MRGNLRNHVTIDRIVRNWWICEKMPWFMKNVSFSKKSSLKCPLSLTVDNVPETTCQIWRSCVFFEFLKQIQYKLFNAFFSKSGFSSFQLESALKWRRIKLANNLVLKTQFLKIRLRLSHNYAFHACWPTNIL